MNTGSELVAGLELWAETRGKRVAAAGDESIGANARGRILQLALVALTNGRTSEAVEQFAESFTFKDHALTLEFMDKQRLAEFFEKSHELFPDAALEVVSLLEDGDHAIAQWKLSATQTVPYGSISRRLPISLFGATIARVENGRIVHWSDYYDQISSRRMSLAAFFTDWIEY